MSKTCPNCKGDISRGCHFVPPSTGEPGIFACANFTDSPLFVPDPAPSQPEPSVTKRWSCRGCEFQTDDMVMASIHERRFGHFSWLFTALVAPQATAPEPVPMNLRCPKCGAVHIDEGKWAIRPHKTHQCQSCGNEWRPFEYATVGVAAPPPVPQTTQHIAGCTDRYCNNGKVCSCKCHVFSPDQTDEISEPPVEPPSSFKIKYMDNRTWAVVKGNTYYSGPYQTKSDAEDHICALVNPVTPAARLSDAEIARDGKYDVSNLRLYASLFAEHKWETRELSYSVFVATLNAIADRVASQRGREEANEQTRLGTLRG